VDDAYGSDFSSTWAFYCFYSKYSSDSFYLYIILSMIKIFKKINNFTRIGINILIRLLLGIIYFILLFPFVIFIKLLTDFLEIKSVSPYWIPHNKIEDVKKFLTQQ
jgi:type IV secretory pathway VirB6-like protein